MDGPRLVVRLSPGSLAISAQPYGRYVFDALGRLFYACRGGNIYRRRLNNRVFVQPVRSRTELIPTEFSELNASAKQAFYDAVLQEMAELRTATMSDRATVEGGSPPRVARATAWFDRVLSWDSTALERDAQVFLDVYRRPIGFLPPDRQVSVVLQICPNRLAQRRRLLELQEFRTHVQSVYGLVGSDPIRRDVFLAGPNVLGMPLSRLRTYLRVVRCAVPATLAATTGGFSSYVPDAVAVSKAPGHWGGLKRLGLKRVYVGAETGCPALRHATAKPSDPAHLRQLVASLRSAGIAVGVVVVAGIGGRLYHASHMRATADLIQSLGLSDPDSLGIAVGASWLGDTDGSRPPRDGWSALGEAEMAEQVDAFRLAARKSHGGPRVAEHSIAEFAY